jgi:hypothetical protein
MKSNHNTGSNAKRRSPDSTKSCNQPTEDEIKDEPRSAAREDQLISMLHLGDLSGLQGLMKRWSLDYETLEQYSYYDIIPSEIVSPNGSNESELEEDNRSC